MSLTFQFGTDFYRLGFTKAMHGLSARMYLGFWVRLQKTSARKKMSGLHLDKDTPRCMAWPLVVASDPFSLSHCAFNLSLVTGYGDAVYLSLSAQVVDHPPVARMTQLMRHCYDPLGTMMTPPTFVGYRSATSLVKTYQPSCPLWQTD